MSTKPPLEAVLTYARGIAAGQGHFDEDTRQAAMLGGWEAWSRYEPERHPNFEIYARSRILGAIVDHQRSLYPKGLRKSKKGWKPPAPLSHDVIEDADEVGWELEAEEEARRILETLSCRQKEAMLRRFLLAGTPSMREIGRAMGCTESNVSILLKRALEALRGKTCT